MNFHGAGSLSEKKRSTKMKLIPTTTTALIMYLFSLAYPQNIPEVYLQGISFADSLNGCTVGDEGVILYTEDGGRQWLPADSPVSSRNFRSAFLLASENGWAASNDALFQTDDGGKNWHERAIDGSDFQRVVFTKVFLPFQFSYRHFLSP